MDPQPSLCTTTGAQLVYPDTLESPSPHLTTTCTTTTAVNAAMDDGFPPPKLRLMCSYGGHIIPRPHSKTLTYIGGETRIVVVDRTLALSSLYSRLSHHLLNNRPFTLKYQLPNEDLDSLISVTTEEDLHNMIEEHDRTVSSLSTSKPSRLRLFLFPVKPETAASMGSLLDDSKSETWFVDALNNAGFFPRGLSDSAAIDTLLGLDENHDLENNHSDEKQGRMMMKNGAQEVQCMPDSPAIENSSSFESSSSSPSVMANLAPIRVKVEEQMGQMNLAKQDDEFIVLGNEKQVGGYVGAEFGGNLNGGNRVCGSDDERSETGGGRFPRKPPLPLQSVQVHQKGVGGFSLPSPDSVASDCSAASGNSLLKKACYQDQIQVGSRVFPIPVDPQDPNSRIQMQQFQEPGYLLTPQLDHQQQQIIQANTATTQYIQHPPTEQVPMSSFYQMYAPQVQQQLHPQIDQQMYLLPSAQAQPYNYSLQSNIADSTAVASSRPPNPSLVIPSSHPPIYRAKAISPAPAPASAPATAGTTTTQLVQVPSNQFQQPYIGLTQLQHPVQSAVAASNTNYGYEYAHPAHEQVYHAQTTQTTSLLPQYQTITPVATIMLTEATAQVPSDNMKQQIRSSEALQN
ncbi:PB1 domain [Dillenia turbinata]|uniref:PB1 domain n=1 Tax=Dillenia turbinata TaxID=194707 RepID=A0AAN8Z316_9MAGN